MGLEVEALSFLADIAIMMLMALVLGYIANRLGQPAMLGYLFAGMIIGPYSWSHLINNLEEIESLAKVGVSLLLFMVGLEFSPKKLRDIWRPSAISGSFEMGFMFVLGTVVGLLLGWTLAEAAFLGAILMISSTIIILKVLAETGQTDTLHGRLLVGRLIVEDIGAIVVITAISSLTSPGGSLLRKLAPVAVGVFFLVLVILLGRRIFPAIIESVSRAHSKELFLLTVFGICITTAVVSEMFGLSLALGAFMAGIILSESEHHLDIESQITPLKDIFLIVFFVSVGMTIDVRYFFVNPLPIVAVIVTLMLGKALANSVTTRLMGYHPKTATLVGLSMMQIGEFSFIIASIGVETGILVTSAGTYSEAYSVIVATALISMVFTPYAIKAAPGFYKRLLDRGLIRIRPEEEELGELDKETEVKSHNRMERDVHVLVLGAARVAEEAMKCLDLIGQPYTVVDYDPAKIHRLRDRGADCVYGDASSEAVLRWAGAGYASLIIVAISDTIDAENALRKCREMNPDAYIIARAYGDFDRERMSQEAQDIIISEEVAGKRMAWHVLRNLGIEEDLIKQDIEIVDHQALTEETRTLYSE